MRTRRSVVFAAIIAAVFFITPAGSSARRLPESARHTPVLAAPADPGLLQLTAGGHALGFSPDAVHVATGSHALRVEFVGAAGVSPVAEGGTSKERGGIASFGRVSYTGLWEGVDLAYDATPAGILRSTWTLAPGADPSCIRLRYSVPVTRDGDGSLRFQFANGWLGESAPVAWQEIEGRRVPVEVAFREVSGREVGFTLGAYDHARPLWIDPTLSWSSLLGGEDNDSGEGITVDGAGNVYVVGYSYAGWGNPVRSFTPFIDDDNFTYSDAFVAKFNSSGTLVWNTFLGDTSDEEGYAIAVDSGGNVYVAGLAWGTWGSPLRAFTKGFDDYGYPTTDAFVAKLSNAGVLLWSTFLGSADSDAGQGIAVDGAGNVLLCGGSEGTWGSPLRPQAPGEWCDDYDCYKSSDAFVAKLDRNGKLLWNTFLGTSGMDFGNAITVDGNGSLYLCGYSTSGWGNPARPFSGSAEDAFVAKLGGDGNLLWNTFLGSDAGDIGSGVAVDADGNVYMAGSSKAQWGSPVRPFSGSAEDAFVAKLGGDGSLVWNTFLGSAGRDFGNAIARDGSGNLYVTGTSYSTWGNPASTFSGASDAYVARLGSDGALSWNTFYGTAEADHAYGIAVSGLTGIYVTGSTPDTFAADDAFVIALSGAMLPDSGQNACYQALSPYDEIPCGGTGQDGSRDINPITCADNGDGTVTDANTGLMWQKDDDGFAYSWYQAAGVTDATHNPTGLNACREVAAGGYTDWRLPSKKELATVVDYGVAAPGPTIMRSVFPNTKGYPYWSSSSYAPDAGQAWRVEFGSGGIGGESKTSPLLVRCVRGGRTPAALEANGDGTVTHARTGLVWQEYGLAAVSWGEALAACAGLSLAGASDWRLPNVKELESLTDDSRFAPALNPEVFAELDPDTFFEMAPADYWTSTTDASAPGLAWYVRFESGAVGTADKSGALNVRCVRGWNPDVVDPVIVSGPNVSQISTTGASLWWEVDEGADGTVWLGTDAAQLAQVASDAFAEGGHTVPLTGLAPSTTYYLKVVVRDAAGNTTASEVVSFTTSVTADTAPPRVTQGPLVAEITDSGAAVWWSTDEPSTAVVACSDGQGSREFEVDVASTSHLLRLTGLSPSTAYQVQVTSRDAFGNVSAPTAPAGFTTLEEPDTLPPTIVDGPEATPYARGVLIRWATDEAADSRVEYGTDPDEMRSSKVQSGMTRLHQVMLTGLEPGREYHYRVSSRDAAGNGPKESGVRGFTTVTAAPSLTATAPELLYVSDTTAVVRWETSAPSDTVVEYYPLGTGSPVLRYSDERGVTRHLVYLTNLAPGVVYGARAFCRTPDAGGGAGTVQIPEIQIATAQAPDTTPPVITAGPDVVDAGTRRATVTWSTDEAADALVFFQAEGDRHWRVTGFIEDSLDHEVALTGLRPDTSYRLYVESSDPMGNGPVRSGEVAFTTPGNSAPALDEVADMEVSENHLLAFTAGVQDSDDDTLTYSSPGLPDGASLDSRTGVFRWIPSFGQAGSYTIPITVADDGTPPLEVSKDVTVFVGRNNYRVRVDGRGAGFGVVASSGGVRYAYPGVRRATTADLAHGAAVKLTASAKVGSTVGWPDCAAIGGVAAGNGTRLATCTIPALHGDRILVASFSRPGVKAVFRSDGLRDGWVLESRETSGVGGKLNATDTTLRVGDNERNRQYLSVLSFNTAGLPDSARLMSAKVRLRLQGTVGTNPFSTHGNLLVDAKLGAFSNSASLELGDFRSPATRLAAATILNKPVSGWYSTALAGAYVNLKGPTQLRLRFAKDDNNDRGADCLSLFSGNASTPVRPVLEVLYYVP